MGFIVRHSAGLVRSERQSRRESLRAVVAVDRATSIPDISAAQTQAVPRRARPFPGKERQQGI